MRPPIIKYGAMRVRHDYLNRLVLLLEEARGAAHRASGGAGSHQVRDLAVGLRPQLRPERRIVRFWVERAVILVEAKVAWVLLHQLLLHVLVVHRRVGGHAGGRDDNLRAVRVQLLHLLLARPAVGDGDAPVASQGRKHGERGGRVARRGGDDGLPREAREPADSLLLIQDVLDNPVLDGAARVGKFSLAQHAHALRQVGSQRAQIEQRRVADADPRNEHRHHGHVGHHARETPALPSRSRAPGS
mmetsp:Transcript_33520/g.108167  ORF Transcript_33520/g.108167 Transcript_33520/m.108167 type:complete len:245 (-) Transcript_33520:156-890(-)